MDKLKWIAWRALYEIWAYPYYVLLFVVLLLWLSEGVAEQSGWINCPRPPS